MATSTNNLAATVTTLDALNATILQRSLTATYGGSASGLREGSLPDNSAHAQSLPIATVRQYYLKNTHASATITVTWTPAGGASAVVQTVGPGGVLLFWQKTTDGGITALSYQASAAATFEDFMGG